MLQWQSAKEPYLKSKSGAKVRQATAIILQWLVNFDKWTIFLYESIKMDVCRALLQFVQGYARWPVKSCNALACPTVPVEAAVLNGFGQMMGLYPVALLEVGNGA